MTGEWNDLVIRVNDTSKLFPTVGPFRVQLDTSVITVRSGSELVGGSVEALQPGVLSSEMRVNATDVATLMTDVAGLRNAFLKTLTRQLVMVVNVTALSFPGRRLTSP